MTLREEILKISTNWREILLKILDNHPDIEDKYNKEINLFDKSLQIYPKKENIFRCFNYTDVEKTRVIILGQDPYHGENQAIGLSFGVNENIKHPPSLRNIFKKLENSRTATTLEWWAQQGVLMLNTALTVRQKTPGSHLSWWLPFTKDIIKYLNDSEQSGIFVAWGAFAHNQLKHANKHHHLLVSSHPSPLSYFKKYKKFPAFKDAEPFKEINARLINPIIW